MSVILRRASCESKDPLTELRDSSHFVLIMTDIFLWHDMMIESKGRERALARSLMILIDLSNIQKVKNPPDCPAL